MSTDVTTSRSVREVNSLQDRVRHWLLLEGDRLGVAAAILGVVLGTLYAGIRVGLFAVGPRSIASTAYGSGLISGTLTLTTIALSVNQLILSRVFGSPNEFLDRLDGTRELRNRVAAHTDQHATPNDPAAFLALLADTLVSRVERLRAAIQASDWEPPAEVDAYVEDLHAYGENIDSKLERETNIVNALAVVRGTEYATNLTATDRLRGRYRESLSRDASDELDAIEELLEAVAVTRQFFKTLSLQQDFARLSRGLAYSGLIAVCTSFALTLLYRTNSVTVPLESLPIIVAVGSTIVLAPLTVFIAYILRAATIAHKTVSVGPFVPPTGQEE